MRCTVRPFMMELFLFHRLDRPEGVVKFKGFCMVDKNLTGLLRFFMVDLNFFTNSSSFAPHFLVFSSFMLRKHITFSLSFTMASLRFIWFRLGWKLRGEMFAVEMFFSRHTAALKLKKMKFSMRVPVFCFFSTLSPRCFWSGIFEQVPPFFPTSNGALRQGVLGFALFIYGPFTCNFFYCRIPVFLLWIHFLSHLLRFHFCCCFCVEAHSNTAMVFICRCAARLCAKRTAVFFCCT